MPFEDTLGQQIYLVIPQTILAYTANKCGNAEVFKEQKTINRWVFLIVIGLILNILKHTKW